MGVNRRQFVSAAASITAVLKTLPPSWAFAQSPASAKASALEKASGSHFGNWMEDEFGLPAFHYTCEQASDPKAVTSLNRGLLGATEHIHQVGNDRLVALASNYGHLRVRQDEGAPKFLNDYAPERGYFAGGIGYLTDGERVLSTAYSGNTSGFDRFFGVGYFRKRVGGHPYNIDQVLFAPFGDDPVVVSQVTIQNSGPTQAKLRWIEYWNCQPYQFSFRSFMEAMAADSKKDLVTLRRDLGARFQHRFERVDNGSGLLEHKEFLGWPAEEESRFKALIAELEKRPDGFLTAPLREVPRAAAFDDLSPPPTFLVSLDGPADRVTTNAKNFFGSGGAARPSGLERPLDGDLGQSGSGSGLLLEREFSLEPGASRTLSFLYGYLVSGTDLEALIAKYRGKSEPAWRESSDQWKKRGMRFSTPDEPWVEREVTWDHYYLRSGFTYDDFFHQHIVSQAGMYQYVMGFQGAARDPLQHVLPLLFTDPELVKEVLRYTFKQVRPDGSIPYGIVGHGMPMPTTLDRSSDIPLWLLWVASEYILATRDQRFLDSDVVTLFGGGPGRDSVRGLLSRCYRHLVDEVKTGEHGLMRMLHDDWNDELVMSRVPPSSLQECLERGESVLNSAMAAYVFEHYARALTYAGDDGRLSSGIRGKAEDHRQAVRAQWTGKWFRRAWLGPTLGWLGDKGMWLEPQPWAILGGSASDEQTHSLIEAIDHELRQASPIGAVQLSEGPEQQSKAIWHPEPGTSGSGGVWPALNQTLIWALARVDGPMAWDEWKKNSLARHSEVYPDVWYGTWSGPDVLNSRSSKHPGQTTGGTPFGRTDFPALNMHAHACPLFSAAMLLGLEFTESGVSLAPQLPLSAFRFESPLLGFIKSPAGYEGWYSPMSENTWSIRLRLASEDARRLTRVAVNGERMRTRLVGGEIEMRGQGGAGRALRWSVSRSGSS